MAKREDGEISQAPFNMALSTLESIRKWIDRIAELSVGIYEKERIEPNEIILIKHRMLKQLIMLAAPLLEKEYLEEIEEYFKTIKLARGRIRTSNGWNNNVIVYDQDVDYEMDYLIQGVELALQESGHFMPSPDESALF